MSRRGAGYHSRNISDDLAVADTGIRRFGLVALLVAVVVAGFVLSGHSLGNLNHGLIAVVGALGLHVVTGYAGQLSLGHAALLGVSGFLAGTLVGSYDVPFLVVLLLSAGAGAVIGVVLGLPALRLRGLYLILATVAFHFIAVFFLSEFQSNRSGLDALTGMQLPKPAIGPWQLSTPRDWFYFLSVLAALVTMLVVNLSRTRPGRAWIALRDKDLVAASLGINLLRYKLSAFTVSSALAGLAGGLLAYYNGAVSAESYTLHVAVLYLVMVIAGGLGSTAGAVIGAIFVTVTPPVLALALEQLGLGSATAFRVLIPLELVVFGAIMLAFLLFEPLGLMGLWRRLRLYFELWPLRMKPLAERRR
jgi:branched-chain amino acid transport system permease protein